MKYEPKNWIVCYFPVLSFIGGEWIHVPKWGTGRLGKFAWNLEFLKNKYFFFVSIFYNRKAKLKQNGYMKQHCWKETTLKSWVITKSGFYELLSICIEMIVFYPITTVFLKMTAMQRRKSLPL